VVHDYLAVLRTTAEIAQNHHLKIPLPQVDLGHGE
jgi:hypothetical protein